MRLWGYYAWHTFINSIKKSLRSKVVIAIYLLLFAFVIFMVYINVNEALYGYSSMSIKVSEVQKDHDYLLIDSYDSISVSDYYLDNDTLVDDIGDYLYIVDVNSLSEEQIDYLMDDYHEYYEPNYTIKDVEIKGSELTKDKLEVYDGSDVDPFSGDTFNAFVTCGLISALLILIVFGIVNGSKRGSNIFLMSDVNFLFPAPLKPQSVLMFRLSFQLIAMLAGILGVLYQIPNLLNSGISIITIFVSLLEILLAFTTERIVSVLSYTIASTHEKWKYKISYIGYAIVVFTLVIYAFAYILMDAHIVGAVNFLFGNPYICYIPLIGWFAGILLSAITKQYLFILLYFGLYVALLLIIIYGIWQLKADFYEDALSGAIQKEELMESVKSKNKIFAFPVSEKKRKEAKDINTSFKGEGANLFFYKEVFTRKRDVRFGFISSAMSVYFGITLLIVIFINIVADVKVFEFIPLLLIAILFFINFGNPIARETSNIWIYLVPESPYKKVFYSMLASTYNTLIDVLPSFILGMIVNQYFSINVILWLLLFLVVDFMYSSFGLLLETVLPFEGLDNLKQVFVIILKMIITLIICVVGFVLFFVVNMYLALLVSILLCAVVGFICFYFYPTFMGNNL